VPPRKEAVQDAMDRDFELISMGVPMRELAEKVSKHRSKSYFVVDENKVLSGEIVLDDLEGLLQDISLTAVVADDLTRPVTATCFADAETLEKLCKSWEKDPKADPVKLQRLKEQLVETILENEES